MSKVRREVRQVRVDVGYGPAERWETVKVIDERACQSLFGEGTETDLLVELSGGERMWVSFWEEMKENNENSI